MLMKKPVLFILIGLLQISNYIYAQRLIDASSYYKDPSKSAIVNPDRVTIRPDTGDSRLLGLDSATRMFVTNQLNEARKLIDDGKFFEARLICDSIESKFNNYYEIYFLRALAFQRQGDLYYAKLDFDKAISYYPRVPLLYQRAGEFYEMIGQYESALIVYISAFKVFNNEYSWIFLAGNLALKNQDTKSANYYYMMGIKSRQDGYSYEGLGNLEFQAKNFDTALDGYRVAASLYAKNERRYTNSFLANDNIFRTDDEISNAIINKDVANWEARFLVKDFQNALLILQGLSRYTSKYPELMLYTAKTQFEMGQYREAKNTLLYTIKLAPEFDEAHVILAQIYVYENNYAMAIKTLENAFNYAYGKPLLYEALANLLYSRGSIYYANRIISQLSKYYDVSPENKVRYAKYLIRNKEYDEAEKILNSLRNATDESVALLKSIEYRRILDQSSDLYEKKYYVDIMRLLSVYRFTGIEEQIRIRYLANAYNILGSLDKAIDVLKESFNAGNIGINNVYFLRYLLELRRSVSSSKLQRNDDLVDIKATEFWEEELKLDTKPITARIEEFMEYKQFQEALNYISTLRKKGYSINYIKQIESIVYAYYASDLYKIGKHELAKQVSNLAIRRNKYNYDAVAIKREIEINMFRDSLGDYANTDVYVVLSPTMRRIVEISPSYLDNRIELAKSLAREYNSDGYDIIMNIMRLANIPGMKDSLIASIYSESGLYQYADSAYKRALVYNKSSYIRLQDAIAQINTGYYDSALEILKSLTAENNNYADAWYNLSILYSKQKDYAESVRTIEKAISLDKYNNNYLYQYGYAQEMSGNVSTALSIYSSIVRTDRNYAAANYRAALLLLNNFKDPKTAAPYASIYATLVPQDPSGYMLLGNIYEAEAGTSDKASETARFFKLSLDNYKEALSKAIWGKDREVRNSLISTIDTLSLRIAETR